MGRVAHAQWGGRAGEERARCPAPSRPRPPVGGARDPAGEGRGAWSEGRAHRPNPRGGALGVGAGFIRGRGFEPETVNGAAQPQWGVNGTDAYGSAPHSHRKEWWGQMGLLTVPLSTVYRHIPPPCPRLSWRSSRGYFTYRDQNIFYRDSRGTVGSSNVAVLLHGFPTFSCDWYKPKVGGKDPQLFIVGDDLAVYWDISSSCSFPGAGSAGPVEGLWAGGCELSIHIWRGPTFCPVKQYGVQGVGYDLLHCLAQRIDCTQRNHLKQFTKLWMSSRVILCCCSPKVTCGDADCTSVSLHRHILPWVQHCNSSGHLLLSNNRFLFSILQYINQRKKHREHWVGALMPTSVPLHLIYGPLDPVNPHPEFLQLYKKVLPMSTVSVLDDHISHYPQLEDPTGFLNAYLNFINSF
ncbi:mesoderm-specific transcript homolog protein [Guaruba guarouba]